MKRGAVLLLVLAALVMAGGTALAVTKQCPSGTTQANPCKGVPGVPNICGAMA